MPFKINITKLLTMSLLLMAAASCKKQDDSHNHEVPGELLTTIKLMLTDTITGITQTAVWTQPKGPGTAVSVDTLSIKPGVFYSGRTEVWNESVSPAQNMTTEIEELSNEHLFVYSCESSSLKIVITDKDKHEPPQDLGLHYTLQYLGSSAYNGKLGVKLMHFPDANKTDLNSGSTDISVEFPLLIQ